MKKVLGSRRVRGGHGEFYLVSCAEKPQVKGFLDTRPPKTKKSIEKSSVVGDCADGHGLKLYGPYSLAEFTKSAEKSKINFGQLR